MKIALLGYGRMGKEVEQAALKRNHSIISRIDNNAEMHQKLDLLKSCDVAIEFTSPDAVVENLLFCFTEHIPVVTGTTGWNHRKDEVLKACAASGGTLFFASNFSIGVNIFVEINRQLARMMNSQPEYHVSLEEIHHIHKLDAPSGTAITLANGILSEYQLKKSWISGEAVTDQQIGIRSVREGEIPGTHCVEWRSQDDTIRFEHEAFSRKGFAGGAVLAAEFLAGKTGVFEMKDLLRLNQ